MYLSKLSKQLRRDLRKNPKKAGLLALLAVVALWFWAPLVLRSGDAPAVANAEPAAPPTAVQSSLTTIDMDTPPPSIPWNEMAAWMAADARMQSADLAAAVAGRSPFAPSAATLARRQAAAKAQAERQRAERPQEEGFPRPGKAAIDPKQLGIVVSSAMLGPSRRWARINGYTRAEGDEFEIAGIGFRVVEVRPGGVVVEHQGEQFTIRIQRGLSPSDPIGAPIP